MADEPQASADEKREKGFFHELSRSAIKRALAPLAATAATAGTAYLTRKTTQIWQENLLPRIREAGGAKAFTKDALEQASAKLPGDRTSGLLRGLAERLEDARPTAGTGATQKESGGQAAEDPTSDPERERQRQERQQRREQRQRALEKSRPT
jgi:hypothetical protein